MRKRNLHDARPVGYLCIGGIADGEIQAFEDNAELCVPKVAHRLGDIPKDAYDLDFLYIEDREQFHQFYFWRFREMSRLSAITMLFDAYNPARLWR